MSYRLSFGVIVNMLTHKIKQVLFMLFKRRSYFALLSYSEQNLSFLIVKDIYFCLASMIGGGQMAKETPLVYMV